MHCTGNITQPCLPSDFDRFNAPKSTSTINPKPHSPTARSSINVYKPTTSDVGDNQKGLLNKTNLRRTIHPEGSIIHHGDHVVSNGQLDQPLETLGKSLLDQAGLVGCATVFLIPEGPYVRYYLADHSTKTIMWVGGDNLPSAILAADPQRVPNMLCEEYWTHMENFPAPVPAAAEDLQQLKEVLVSLAVDSNTSDGSTSPFSSAQIQQFLAMLNAFSNGVETFQTYTIARLWCMIWHARVVNNFGTNDACLDRFMSLSGGCAPEFSGPYASYASYLIGGDARGHLARCARAWAGRIAYVSEWRRFKLENEQEWNQVMYLACVLIVSSLLVRGQGTIRFASNIAIVLTCASAAISYYLVSESQNLGEQAADASVHFQCWEAGEYGIQSLAVRNAVPRAFLVWGFMAFMISLF